MKNIVLVGMPASGKTTIGKLLAAQLLGYSFVDTDEVIEKEQGILISEIFAKNGEDYFRTLETNTLKTVLKKENQVVSTGGGIILKEENRQLLKENSFVVYLKTDIPTLCERAKRSSARPLLNGSEQEKKIETLLNQRENLYESVSDFIIDTRTKTQTEILNKIIEKCIYK